MDYPVVSSPNFKWYKTFFDDASVGMVVTDSAYRFVDVNQAFCDFIGYSKDELLKMSILDITFKDDLRESADKLKKQFAGTISNFKIEKRYVKKNGEIVWGLVTSTATLKEGENKPLLNYGVIRDITKEKKLEEELKTSESSYHSLVDQSPDGIAVHSDGVIVFANRSAIVMLGGSREEDLLGKPTLSFVHPDSIAVVKERIAQMVSGGKPAPMIREKFVRLDGGELDVEVSASPILFKGKNAIQVVLHNVTEEKRMLERLRQSEDYLLKAQKAARLGTYSLDVTTGVWVSSKILDEIFGIDEKYEHSLDGWLKLVREDQREMMGKYFAEEVLGKELPFDKEYVIVSHLDGSEHWVHGRGQLDKDSSGKVVRMIGTISDITDRKMIEDEIKRVGQEYEALAACIEAVVRANDEKEMLSKVCQIIVEKAGMVFAWVGYPMDDEEKTIQPVARFGENGDYLDKIKVVWADSESGRGPTGTAVRTKAPDVMRDIMNDERFAPWRDRARERGFHSSAAVPMIIEDKVIGVLSIYSIQSDAFGAEEIKLFLELADDLAFGINSLRSRKTLVQNELKWKTLFDLLPVGVSLSGQESKIVDANKAMEDILGMSRNSLLAGEHLKRKYSKPDGSELTIDELPSHRAVRDMKVIYSEEVGIVKENGEKVWVEVSSAPLPLPDINCVTVTTDITDRKMTQIEVAENQSRLQAILQGIGEGVLVVDGLGKVILFNRSAEIISGHDAAEVISKNLWDVLHFSPEGLLHSGSDFVRQTISTRKTVEATNLLLDKNGGARIPVSVTSSPVFGSKNDLLGVVVAFRDITKQREIENMKGEFMMIASHELRAPMTAIKWLVTMILDGSYGPVDAGLSKPLSNISESTERLIHLVNDMINVTRLEGGSLKIVPAEFDVKKLADSLLTTFDSVSKKKNVSLDISGVMPLKVWADADRVVQIVSNLIDNSIKFTPNGGKVTLSTEDRENFMYLSVSDTGVGIADEFRGRLFTKFGQIMKGAEGKPAGTGLGLYISKSLAKNMNGDLTLGKSEVNKGTTFVLKLPLSAKAKS